MRDFLRSPSENLPKGTDTTLISRQTSSGPQMFALSAVDFQNPAQNSNVDISAVVDAINNKNKHDHTK